MTVCIDSTENNLLLIIFYLIYSWVEDLQVTKYQSDKAMIPYLYSDILKLIKKLMQLIVKPNLLEECKNYLDFRRVDLDGKESITKSKNMDIGFAVRSSI